MVTISLLSYLVVLLFGMAALFRETQDDRKAQIVLTASAVSRKPILPCSLYFW